MGPWSLTLTLLVLGRLVSGDFTGECPSSCTCKWSSGKKVAECVQAGFTAVPNTLSAEIQVLDLSGNPLEILPRDAFRSVGLVNLQRVYVRNCSLRHVDKDAFRDLSIMIEVDISNNRLARIHPDTFTGNEKLRFLYINSNPLEKLEAHQFPALPHLRTLELSHCKLELMDRKAFMHLEALETLRLSDNRLSTLIPDIFLPLNKLKSLSLQNNPWRCDCRLKPLKHYLMEANLYANPTVCAEPNRLAGRSWDQLLDEDFACPPTVEAAERSIEGTAGTDLTMSCKVNGVPQPDVKWLAHGRVLTNLSQSPYADQIYIIRSDYVQEAKVRPEAAEIWSNLTIRRASEQDAGVYTCSASNPGGVAVANVSVYFPAAPVIVTIFNEEGSVTPTVIIGVAAGLSLLLILLVVIVCCFCGRQRRRRRRDTQHLNGNVKVSGNGTCGMDYGDQDKALLNDSNVLSLHSSKPTNPNGYEMVPQTEMTLRESCTYIPAEKYDERLVESMDHLEQSHSNTLPSTARLPPQTLASVTLYTSATAGVDPNLYPDLLDIPHRFRGGSPSTVSGTSTTTATTDASRLPLNLNPAQLAGHPSYVIPDYRIPTHQRSSIASAASTSTPNKYAETNCDVILPLGRPGYVTLPRRPRPRVPSWSSTPISSPSPTTEKTPVAEPLYDTIGPRTTADGSSTSALSLNRIASLTPIASASPNPNHSFMTGSTPLRAGSLTPGMATLHKAALPPFYVPIEEIDIPPSPATTRSHTLPFSTPNIVEATQAEELSLPPFQRHQPHGTELITEPPDEFKQSELAQVPPASRLSVASTASSRIDDTARRKVAPAVAPKPTLRPRPSSVLSQNDSTFPLGGSPVKVPPKPPPKPRKKLPLDGDDSTFQDEGEDGTEV